MWLTGGDSYVHVHTSHAKAALGLKGRSKMGDIVMARVGEKLQSREDPAGVQFPVFLSVVEASTFQHLDDSANSMSILINIAESPGSLTPAQKRPPKGP